MKGTITLYANDEYELQVKMRGSIGYQFGKPRVLKDGRYSVSGRAKKSVRKSNSRAKRTGKNSR